MTIQATFNGKHNMSKSKVLLVLNSSASWASHWYSAVELSQLTGLTLSSTFSLVYRLHNWRYIRRRGAYGSYEYAIGAKGTRFIEERLPVSVERKIQPNLQKLVNKYLKKT